MHHASSPLRAAYGWARSAGLQLELPLPPTRSLGREGRAAGGSGWAQWARQSVHDFPGCRRPELSIHDLRLPM
jgi:hypothetical protein